jgi:hypothetical protein
MGKKDDVGPALVGNAAGGRGARHERRPTRAWYLLGMAVVRGGEGRMTQPSVGVASPRSQTRRRAATDQPLQGSALPPRVLVFRRRPAAWGTSVQHKPSLRTSRCPLDCKGRAEARCSGVWLGMVRCWPAGILSGCRRGSAWPTGEAQCGGECAGPGQGATRPESSELDRPKIRGRVGSCSPRPRDYLLAVGQVKR